MPADPIYIAVRSYDGLETDIKVPSTEVVKVYYDADDGDDGVVVEYIEARDLRAGDHFYRLADDRPADRQLALVVI